MIADNLEQDSNYEVKVEAKNEWGWSQTSDVFRFYTRNKGDNDDDDVDDDHDEDDVDDVDDDISDVESWWKSEAVNQVFSLPQPIAFYHLPTTGSFL